MKYLKLILIVLSINSLPLMLYGQAIVTTTGGNGKGTGGSVSYTVGQVVNNYYNTGSGSVTEGVQQPYEISIETDVETDYNIDLTVSVFPNPAADYLTILIKDYNKEKLHYKLYRVDGKLMSKGEIEENETKVKTANLTPAVYLLRISNGKEDVRVFKIIKN